MQRLCCLLCISKTFWHFPRKSSSQLCQGTFYFFFFNFTLLLSTVSWRHQDGVTAGVWWRGLMSTHRGQGESCSRTHRCVPFSGQAWGKGGVGGGPAALGPGGNLPSSEGTGMWVWMIVLKNLTLTWWAAASGGGERPPFPAPTKAQQELSCEEGGTEPWFLPSRGHCGIIELGRGIVAACQLAEPPVKDLEPQLYRGHAAVTWKN